MGVFLAILIAVLVGVRAALPDAVRWYVHRVLDDNELYDGHIGDIDLHLWRGAYSIEDLRLLETTGNVAVPFFAAERVELAIEWSSLFSGEVVGRIAMHAPELNFVDGDDDSQDQTGAGGAWLQTIRDLFPFTINSAEILDGRITFRAFQSDPPVDVYLADVQGRIENLTNIHEDVTPMFSTVTATAVAMDHAQVELEMMLDPFSYRPTFQLALRLLHLDVTKINDLARAYGDFDFERGWFDLVIELDAKEGYVEGYVKPLFRNLEVFDLARDATEGNLLVVFWEALIGGITSLFENQARDQLATVIPLSGDLTDPNADLLATIGNILRNAFVRAYLPKLQGTATEINGTRFGPASEIDLATTKVR